jgi:outer membrane protein W
MRHIITLAAIFSVLVANSQVINETPSFNQQEDHQLGVAFAITGFSSNFTYYVSPFYAYHVKRHWIAATPFYGRLDALGDQHDIGLGMDYRFYPFKNLNRVRPYLPASLHYTYTIRKRVSRQGILYGIGAGTETELGRNFLLTVDATFSVGQPILITGATEGNTLGSTNQLNFYFLPRISLSYRL